MADIFNEVDEEVRRERLQKLWERYSVYIMCRRPARRRDRRVARLRILSGQEGRRRWLRIRVRAELSEAGKHNEAQAAFKKSPPMLLPAIACSRVCALLPSLRMTSRRMRSKAYDDLAAMLRSGQALQDLAAVRAGMLMVDNARSPT